MTFPAAPADGAYHVEAGRRRRYVAASTAWIIDSPADDVAAGHVQAEVGTELRNFEWPKFATVAALPASGRPGEIVTVAASGANFQWNNRRSTWVPWSGSVNVTVASVTAPVEVMCRSDFVCTGTNDHLVIQAALARIPNGGTVELSAGDYNVGAAIKLSSKQRIRGAGPGTLITPPTGGVSWLASDGSGRQGAIFEPSAQNQEQFGVSHLALLGRSGSGSNLKGIYFNISVVPPSGGDSELFLHDLLIEDFQDNPVHITGFENRAGKASNIRCFVNNAPFLVESGDWECSMIDVGVSGGHGIVSGLAGNIRWVSCKAFYSALSGFRIQGSRTVLVGCEAQDNTQHGFLIEERVNMTGCSADSNGYNGTNTPTPTYDGVHILDGAPTQFSRISVVAQDKNEGARGLHQRYGIYVSPDATPVVISAVCRNNAVAAAAGDLTVTPDRSIEIVPGMGHLNTLTRAGSVTAPALTADTNNWTIAGFATASTVRVSATPSAWSVTGLAGGVEGREVVLHNTGTSTIFLRANNAGSLAANRFGFVGDLVIDPRAAAVLRYSNGAWICLSSMQDYPGYTYIDANPWKFSVRASANTNVAALSGLQTIDGETLVDQDRVLLLNQTAPADNGIWVVSAGGWSRPQDADTGVDMTGMVVYVRRGTARGNTAWVQTDEDSNPPTFAPFPGGGGGGTPAGVDTQVQFNNAGAFGADPTLTFNPSTDTLSTSGLTVNAAMSATATITPAALAANTNDYNPAGLATTATVRASATAPVQLTGLAAQGSGRQVALRNVGAQAITLVNASASSVAANRFAFSRDLVLAPGDGVELAYDATLARWVARAPIPAPGAAAAAGATTQVQYNNAGALAGNAGMTFDQATNTLGLTGSKLVTSIATPATPAAGLARQWVGDLAGPVGPQWMAPDGIPRAAQAFLGRSQVGWWMPPGNATTAPGVLGMAALTAINAGTAKTVATTNLFTRQRRLAYSSTAVAGTVGGARLAVAQITTGTGTLGGFLMACRFGCADAATVAGARQFVGVSSSTAAPTNVEPSTLTNVIGVGNGAANTNLFLYSGAGTANAPVDLGATFPANTLSVDIYELVIYCPVQGGATWRLTRLNTGATATGTLAAGSIPAGTTLLTPFTGWRSNGATALAVTLDIGHIYYEAD